MWHIIAQRVGLNAENCQNSKIQPEAKFSSKCFIGSCQPSFVFSNS